MTTVLHWAPPTDGTSPRGIEGYDEVRTQAEANALRDCWGGFHDTLVREVLFESRGCYHTPTAGTLFSEGDVRIVMHAARRRGSLELVGGNLLSLQLEGVAEQLSSGSIVVSHDPLTDFPRVSVSLGGKDFAMSCRRLFYRLRPDWTGPAARIGFEIPQRRHALAQVLGDGWVQCGECNDTFIWSVPALPTTRCPHCCSTVDLVEPLT